MSRVSIEQGASPKRETCHDEEWRREVASRPCKACGYHKSQAAHITHGNHARGMKPPDWLCIPLCPDEPGRMGCHASFDARQVSFSETILKMSIAELKAEAMRDYQDFQEWKAENG